MNSESRSSEPRNVPLDYLRNITNNFSDELLLGEGGFGTVYKGVLKNGETIAVKKLNNLSIPGVQDRQFENEASHLMRLKHPNVVLLVGWCSETEYIPMEYNGKYIYAEKRERLLCLEYMPKGNLREYLSDASSGLDWDTRYNIIKGICYGLRYLHEQWQPNAPIVHMDLKPANILLDNNMVPKIADFGLSRLFSEEKTWTCTISRNGTLGYMSPEYIDRGLISTKSDIFSLGVIIIEIVTGGKEYPDESGTSSEDFIKMVLNNWSRRKRVGVSFGLSLEVESQQIRQCIQIGLDCVKSDRSKRPTVSQIIKTLHGPGPRTVDSSNIKGVRRPQSEKADGNCGETSRMERVAKKHTPGFFIDENFTVDLHQSQKKTGVESVTPDMAAGKIAVIGTADAVELKERIEARAKKAIQIVSADAGPSKKDKEKQKEKKVDGGGGEKKADNERVGGEKKTDKEKGSGGEKKADKGKGAYKPKEETVTLKIYLHCDHCINRIKRRIEYKVEGVKETAFDAAKDLVKVTGTMDTAAMQAYLKEKLNRNIEIVAPGKEDVDKNDNGAGDEREKKADKEKDGGGGEKKADKEKGGGSEKKAEKEKGADKPKGETVTLKIRLHCDGCGDRVKRQICKIKGVEDVAFNVANSLVKVTGTMDAAALAAYLSEKLSQNVKIIAPDKKDGDKKDKGAGDEGEKTKDGGGEEKKDKAAATSTSVADAGFYSNNAVHEPLPTYDNGIAFYPPPQMFSDENPNACSIM